MKITKTTAHQPTIVDIETLQAGDCFYYFKPSVSFESAVNDDSIYMIGKDGLETKDKVTIVQLAGDYAVTKRPKGLLVIKIDTNINVQEIKTGEQS